MRSLCFCWTQTPPQKDFSDSFTPAQFCSSCQHSGNSSPANLHQLRLGVEGKKTSSKRKTQRSQLEPTQGVAQTASPIPALMPVNLEMNPNPVAQTHPYSQLQFSHSFNTKTAPLATPAGQEVLSTLFANLVLFWSVEMHHFLLQSSPCQSPILHKIWDLKNFIWTLKGILNSLHC